MRSTASSTQGIKRISPKFYCRAGRLRKTTHAKHAAKLSSLLENLNPAFSPIQRRSSAREGIITINVTFSAVDRYWRIAWDEILTERGSQSVRARFESFSGAVCAPTAGNHVPCMRRGLTRTCTEYRLHPVSMIASRVMSARCAQEGKWTTACRGGRKDRHTYIDSQAAKAGKQRGLVKSRGKTSDSDTTRYT